MPDYTKFATSTLSVASTSGDEYTVKCLFHDDGNASMQFNIRSGLYLCLAGDTGVVTWDGITPIRELAGTSPKLLTSAGWQVAPIQSFGMQRLWEVNLSRNGVKKTIYATKEHRWFAITGHTPGRIAGSKADNPLPPPIGGDRRREFSTDKLLPGYALATVTLPNGQNTKPSPWGIAHGAVYGDGCVTPAGWSRITLYGEKDAVLAKYFPLSPTYIHDQPGYNVKGLIVDRLPRFFKSLPSLDEPATYLFGWLAGYFAADGSVSATGHPSLASANKDNLRFVRKLCNRLGIKTYGISQQVRTGYGKEPTPLYSLSFVRSTLNESFFLIDAHRERWLAASKVKERQRWVVESVKETDRVEEVFCAVVPTTHDFVLEDHILTGNCWSCGAKGNIVKLQKHLGVMGIDTTPDLDDLRKKIQELTNPTTTPTLAEHTLQRYKFPTDYWTVKRRFSDDAIRLFQLGYDPLEDHAIIPVRNFNSELISIIRRDLDPKAFIRYRNGKKFPRKSTLFGAWLVAKYPTDTVVVCEGPLDAISVWSAGIPAVAQFGSSMSEEQRMILMQLGVTKVVLFYDNDRSGRGATQQAYELLRGEFLVHRVMYRKSDGKDPGEMSRASIERRVEKATRVL